MLLREQTAHTEQRETSESANIRERENDQDSHALRETISLKQHTEAKQAQTVAINASDIQRGFEIADESLHSKAAANLVSLFPALSRFLDTVGAFFKRWQIRLQLRAMAGNSNRPRTRE